MSKFLLSSHPKQPTPAMPPSHPHTVRGVVASPLMPQEDEDDICPVCDGECTCTNKSRPVHPTSTTNAAASSSSASAAPRPPAPTPKLPSLKIRLTIPPSMLGNRRLPSFTKLPSFKKNKTAVPTTSASVVGGGTYTPPPPPPPRPSPRPSPSFSSQYGTVPKKRGRPPKPIPSARPHGVKANNDALSFYHPSQAARRRKPAPTKKAAGTPRIPAQLKGKGTTVKKAVAAKRRRIDSDESSSELSDMDDGPYFDDDRGDARSIQLPTFVSASALSSSSDSDAVSSSGFDTDSSMEAEEENFIVAEETEKSRLRRELLGEDGQKRRTPHNNWVIRPRKRSVGPSDAEMEVDSDATEDEDEEEEEEEQEEEEDDEADELPTGSGYIGLGTGWFEEEEESSFDADLFFANLTDSEEDDHSTSADENDERGEEGDQSDLDGMSLTDAALAGLIPRLRRDLENLPFELTEGWDGQVIFSNGLRDGRSLLDMDFEVTASLVETSPSPSQESENGDDMETEEDDFEGDTTDEELRAMRLFNLPFSVSSINPMSTMSPSASPAPRSLGLPQTIRHLCFVPRHWSQNGCFHDTHASIPSPHPRVRGHRRNSASHSGRTSSRHPLSRPQSLPPTSQPSFQLLSSSELTTSPELPPQTIDLDDVLDSAFLDSEPSDAPVPASPTEQSRKHLNLSRWGWGSDTPGNAGFRECLEKQSVKQHDVAGQGRQTATPPSRARRRSYTHEHGTQSTAPSERCPEQKPEGDEARSAG
ncbi:hypothetical protein B0H14DRAFT_2707307 [Mycena olivaceomarginata]|nr:hypothetical protein B0H14DRAFT_2707307 [Mycena olivaceomarginata]